MLRPQLIGQVNPSRPLTDIAITLVWEDESKVLGVPAVPRKGDKIYAIRSWEEPMEVEDVHWDVEAGRIFVYLQ